MILKIYHNGKIDGVINMNRITSIVVNEYVLHKETQYDGYTLRKDTYEGDGIVLFYEKNVEIGYIGLHPETEERLIDLENENKYHKINEIIRDIAEEISNYWDCATGVTLLNIDISDKYEEGYEII